MQVGFVIASLDKRAPKAGELIWDLGVLYADVARIEAQIAGFHGLITFRLWLWKLPRLDVLATPTFCWKLKGNREVVAHSHTDPYEKRTNKHLDDFVISMYCIRALACCKRSVSLRYLARRNARGSVGNALLQAVFQAAVQPEDSPLSSVIPSCIFRSQLCFAHATESTQHEHSTSMGLSPRKEDLTKFSHVS